MSKKSTYYEPDSLYPNIVYEMVFKKQKWYIRFLNFIGNIFHRLAFYLILRERRKSFTYHDTDPTEVQK